MAAQTVALVVFLAATAGAVTGGGGRRVVSAHLTTAGAAAPMVWLVASRMEYACSRGHDGDRDVRCGAVHGRGASLAAHDARSRGARRMRGDERLVAGGSDAAPSPPRRRACRADADTDLIPWPPHLCHTLSDQQTLEDTIELIAPTTSLRRSPNAGLILAASLPLYLQKCSTASRNGRGCVITAR